MKTDNLHEILKGFGDLDDFVAFLNEKINDGEQISMGKSPTDKSKIQKEAEGEAPAEGGEEAGGATAPIIDPSQAPGSQISIGNKQDVEDEKFTNEIKISGKQNEIDVEPSVSLNFNGHYGK